MTHCGSPFEGCYREKREKVVSELATMISEGLFQHCLRVEQTAVELAQRWDQEEEKASLAALLHDCAREMPRDVLLKRVDEFGIVITDVERSNSVLMHSAVGAEIARRQWQISDRDILNAICYHTTGRPGMSDLEKVIYLADAIEPERDYPGVERIRCLVREDLAEACRVTMDGTLCYVIRRGLLIHPRTVEARNWLITCRLPAFDDSGKGAENAVPKRTAKNARRTGEQT